MSTHSIAELVGTNPNGTTTAAPNFDRLARLYHWMEYLSFGPMLERCRFHFLGECARSRRALILGDGDGRFTARLLAANQNVNVNAVDSSSAMLDELRRRSRHVDPSSDARLQMIQADLRNWRPAADRYDLIVSHFFLDCMTTAEVDDLMRRVLPCVDERALWLVSEFAIPEGRWRGACAHVLVRALYLAFAAMTGLRVRKLPDYAECLIRHGFRKHKVEFLLGGLLTAELWERGCS